MRAFVNLRSATLATTLLLGFAGTMSAMAETSLRLGHAVTPQSAHGVLADKWAEFAGEASGGDLKITVFPQGQLGDEATLVESLQLGTLDMGVITTNVLIPAAPAMSVLGMPFAFADYEDAHKFLAGKAGEVLKEKLKEASLVALGFADTGFRSIGNNARPLHTPEDLKGVKIRVIQAPLNVSTMNAMGANAVPMAWGEVIPSLKQGIIDGVASGNSYFYTGKLYEYTKFMSLTNHSYSGTAALVSLSRWNNLTPEQQKVLQEAALKAIPLANKTITDLETEMVPAMEAAGTKVNTVDPAAFRGNVQHIWAEFEPKIGTELMDLLRAHVGQ